MNILVDAHVFDSKYQGTRSHLKGLYSALIPLCKHWNFFLAASDIENLKKEFGSFEHVKYIKLKKRNKIYRLLIDFPLIIKRYKIDYSHFQYTIFPISSCKYIVTIHDVLFEQAEYKHYFPLKTRITNHLLHRYSAKKADILLTVSEFSKKKISELYKINKNDIFVTPNAVNDEFFSNKVQEITTPSKYILYVSRIEPRKNHVNLLKAFVELQLKEKGFKLVFIGKNDIHYSEYESYRSLHAQELGHSFMHLESVSNNDLICYYENCSLFVFPSFAEGFGIPPLEAMALQKKVLCSNRTAMKDFNLPEAFLFNPNDIKELKVKIEELLNNSYNLETLYKPILTKYNWHVIAKDFKKIVDSNYGNS